MFVINRNTRKSAVQTQSFYKDARHQDRNARPLLIRITLLCVGVCLFSTGCVDLTPAEKLPQFRGITAEEGIAVLCNRQTSLKSVSGEATIVLTDSAGRSVRLEGAFAFKPPTQYRLRAWKLGSAVFDLTVDGRATYLAADRPEAAEALKGQADHLRSWLRMLTRCVGRDSQVSEDGAFWIVTEPLFRSDGSANGLNASTAADADVYADANANAGANADAGLILRTRIERDTITPREYTVLADSNEVFRLTLADYQSRAGGVVWPMRIVAEGGDSRIEIVGRDVEVNGELPSAAFKPPARAKKLQ